MFPQLQKFLFLTLFIFVACESSTLRFGESIELSDLTSIETLLQETEEYLDKKVLVEGTVKEVCPKKGCWIDLEKTEGSKIRVKVKDDVIVFPRTAIGKKARIEGIVEKVELTHEQAIAWRKHEAEEKGEVFDESSVTGPQVIYRIKGLGAEISQ